MANLIYPYQWQWRLSTGMLLLFVELYSVPSWSQILPPAEDIPEEILQTEIFTEARSPIDGQLLSAAEYAELQDRLRQAPEDVPPLLAPKVKKTIDLLRLRKLFKSLLPFLF